ncbi:MAG: hypothetical protein AAGA93_19270 [Actinomycetota bacterium]
MAEQNLGEWDARPVHPGFEPVRLVDDLFEVDEDAVRQAEEAEALDRGADAAADTRTDTDTDIDTDSALDTGRADHTDRAYHSDAASDDDAGREAGRLLEDDASGERVRPEPTVPLERSRLLPAPPDDDRDWPLGRPPVFWLGVLVGLLPLVALLAGLIGYAIGRGGDGDAVAVDTRAAATAGVPTDDGTDGSDVGATTADGAGTDAGPTDADTVAVDAGTTGTAATVRAAAPSPGPQRLVASGLVSDDTIELAGELPPQRQSQWSGEVRDLATVLGRRLVDGTEVAEPGADAAELTIRFPGAVLFTPDSDVGFDGDPGPVLGAIAGVLNRGTARVTIVAYADPSDPDAAILALSRAGRIHGQLVELGVESDRLAVESRSPGDAPIGVAGDVIDRRADVEFRFRS